jgi:hypothetical protein
MNDFALKLILYKLVHGIHIFPLASAKAKVVQTSAILIKPLATLFRRCAAHQNSRAAADAIQHIISSNERLHLEKVTQPLPKRQAGLRIVNGQLDVRDAIDFYPHARRVT